MTSRYILIKDNTSYVISYFTNFLATTKNTIQTLLVAPQRTLNKEVYIEDITICIEN